MGHTDTESTRETFWKTLYTQYVGKFIEKQQEQAQECTFIYNCGKDGYSYCEYVDKGTRLTKKSKLFLTKNALYVVVIGCTTGSLLDKVGYIFFKSFGKLNKEKFVGSLNSLDSETTTPNDAKRDAKNEGGQGSSATTTTTTTTTTTASSESPKREGKQEKSSATTTVTTTSSVREAPKSEGSQRFLFQPKEFSIKTPYPKETWKNQETLNRGLGAVYIVYGKDNENFRIVVSESDEVVVNRLFVRKLSKDDNFIEETALQMTQKDMLDKFYEFRNASVKANSFKAKVCDDGHLSCVYVDKGNGLLQKAKFFQSNTSLFSLCSSCKEGSLMDREWEAMVASFLSLNRKMLLVPDVTSHKSVFQDSPLKAWEQSS